MNIKKAIVMRLKKIKSFVIKNGAKKLIFCIRYKIGIAKEGKEILMVGVVSSIIFIKYI